MENNIIVTKILHRYYIYYIFAISCEGDYLPYSQKVYIHPVQRLSVQRPVDQEYSWPLVLWPAFLLTVLGKES